MPHRKTSRPHTADRPSGQAIVVALPAEIDISNAEEVYRRLRRALTRDVVVLIADLTATTFCDAAGVRHLALARAAATDRGAELRLAVSAGRVRNVLQLIGPPSLLPFYDTPAEARAGTPSAETSTGPHRQP